ncbi:hypothetical protein Peur_016221 [Populus x canadensis]
MEYYDKGVLWRIGDLIGKALKVDMTTSIGTHGNYTSICVEIDLTKPLLLKFKVRRRSVRRIVCEGLHQNCFQMWPVWHKKEICPPVQHLTENGKEKQQAEGTTGVEMMQ